MQYEVHAPVPGSVRRVTGKPTQRSSPVPLCLVALPLPMNTQQTNQVGICQDLLQCLRNERNEAKPISKPHDHQLNLVYCDPQRPQGFEKPGT